MEGESKLGWDEHDCLFFISPFAGAAEAIINPVPRTLLTTLIMVANELGGKQKAILISSSIRNISRKKKNQPLPLGKGHNWKGKKLSF